MDISNRENNAWKTTESNEGLTESEISFSCYENKIPSYLGMEMEKLYENHYSSLIKFNIENKLVNTSAFVVHKNGRISNILLFRTDGKRVSVLNEFIGIKDDELRQFSHYIFSRSKHITAISFNAIQTEYRRIPFPCQQFDCVEDVVLTLPSSVQEYDQKLSKKLRTDIKYHINRIRRKLPSFSFEIFEKEFAEEKYIRDIIRFNQERMAGKNKCPGISEEEAEHIVSLVKACGMIVVIKVDNNICAGGILFQCGANYFGHLNAHSPKFNEYRMGMVCAYLTICACIDRGGKELHFAWGREEYKYRLQGQQRNFDELVIYRSCLHMIINSRLVMKTALKGRARQTKLWLLDPKRKDHFAVIFAKKMANILRGKFYQLH